MALERHKQALRDFIARTSRGTSLHLPMWLLMCVSVGLPASAPGVFWTNFAGFSVATGLRLLFTNFCAQWVETRTRRARQIIRFLVFLPCLQWSLLAVISMQQGTLHPLMLPLLFVVVGLATAGTVVLSIDRSVRIWYPIAALAPSGAAFLLQPSPTDVLLAIMSVIVIVYVSAATRLVYDSYWAALNAGFVLEERARILESLSTTDALTQIPNRLHFERCMEVAWARAIRDIQPLSVLLIDLDHFKNINDTHGHSIGDDCLKAAARALVRSMLRDGDRVARWGGEEFIVLLPDASHEAAQSVAQRLLQNIAKTVIPSPSGMVRLTCSIGLATLSLDRPCRPEALINEADRALYQAKSQGRNRVSCAA
jgi:diguanylate cyclase (GGDEF)-like protein